MAHGVAARPARERERLVGRAGEVAVLEQVLDELGRGPPAGIELVGEPGIGKTRLLSELAARAERRTYLVLSGSASELERELPFSVFVHALDEYVESLDPEQFSPLDDDVQAELAHVFPALSSLGRGHEVAPQHERYRSHRAVRALLEQLAQTQPLVLLLDDFHWADPASAELLAALLRRPPAAAVLTAVALRPRQTPERLAAALEQAHRAAALTRVELTGFTVGEARELLGERVDGAGATVLFRESGGNPFYLEQLARSAERTGSVTSLRAVSLSGLDVPPAVAASLSEELARLSESGRLVLEGAAVAGDPFELELAAAAASRPEAAAIDAVDELLELDLVRTTDVPRRFRFRHPLVRRAVYDATAAGWRLGAHQRCAEALAARGATAAARAHHVERSARLGDVAAVAVLREAGEAAARLAPESAARWLGGALRLLPQSAPVRDRVELLLGRARALAAAGHFAESHEAMLEAVAIVPPEEIDLSTTVATACAAVERFLGRYEHAHVRLVRALCVLPEPASAESVELLIELTLNEFYRSRYDAMGEWATRAVSAAKAVGDAALIAAALAMPALADAMTGPTETARSSRAESAALVDELPDDVLSLRPDAAAWLAAAEIYLDLYAEADAHASRAFALARASGRGDPLFRLYSILPRIWYVRGKLAEAAELLDAAIEGSRLIGSPPALAGNFFNRALVAVAAGDLDVALTTAEEAFELTRDLDEGFVAAWAAVRLASVLLETAQPSRAAEVLLARAGGEELTFIPGGWRAYGFELLTRCWLALDRHAEAEQAAARAQSWATSVQLPLARAWATRAATAIDLHAGDPAHAAEHALASAAAADEAGAPIEAALARTLAGRALARAGSGDRAITQLQSAAAALDTCGALRYRGEAERQLGRLGLRIHRRTRPGQTNGTGIDTLTARELEVARLVVDRRTNPEIATQLFLSHKTVESHLRNIFRKIDVSSRVELARAVEFADQAAHATGS
jgi:ATP/maltotriose-dependent transcriptional regulator MalT